MIRKPLDFRAVALMTLACFIWAMQQIGLKATSLDAAPFFQIGIRSGIAAVLVFALIRLRGQHVALSGNAFRAGMLAGFLFAIEFLMVGVSVKYTSASHVVVFLYTAPIFAALGLHIKLPSERLALFQWVGIGLAMAGIALTFFGQAAGATNHGLGNALVGDALALAAGAAWGATTVIIRSSSLSSIPATHTIFYQLVAGCVILVGAATATGQTHISWSWALVANLAYQSIVVSFLSFLIWFWLLTKYLASQLGVLSFMTPLFGVVLGWLLLSDPLDMHFVIGTAIVLVGIVVVSGYPWFRQLVSRSQQ